MEKGFDPMMSRIVTATAGIVLAAISVSPSAIADAGFDRFMSGCVRVERATPQLCRDTWDMVRAKKCRSEVMRNMTRYGIAPGDDRAMYNSAIGIQTGRVPLDVC